MCSSDLRLRGTLTAGQDIIVSAGMRRVVDQVSIQIDGTSRLTSTGGGGDIRITGYNDVIVDGVIGLGSNALNQLVISSTEGTLTVAQASGWIETDAPLVLQGATVDLQGVVRSSATSATAGEFAVTIDAVEAAIIEGELLSTGALRIHGGSVTVFNATIAVSQAGQRLVFSGGDIKIGRAHV